MQFESNSKTVDIKLRENWSKGHVECIVDDVVVYSNSEYAFTARFVQNRYNLTDAQVMSLYWDYKEDYDS